jgi:hypothetical protein
MGESWARVIFEGGRGGIRIHARGPAHGRACRLVLGRIQSLVQCKLFHKDTPAEGTGTTHVVTMSD